MTKAEIVGKALHIEEQRERARYPLTDYGVRRLHEKGRVNWLLGRKKKHLEAWLLWLQTEQSTPTLFDQSPGR